MEELGETLRKAREEKGLTLADVEEVTRIRQRYLEALENGDSTSLPARVYVEGFIRGYADYLGLPPQEILARYRKAQQARATEAPSLRPALSPVHVPSRFHWGRAILGGVLLAAVFLAGSAYLQGYLPAPPTGLPGIDLPAPAPSPVAPVGEEPTATPEAVAPEPTLSSLPAATATPTVVPEVRVQVRITEKVWLRVTVDESTAFEGTLEAGDTRSWTGRDKISILSGNAGGTDATVDGVARGPLGAPGQVVEITWTRP